MQTDPSKNSLQFDRGGNSNEKTHNAFMMGKERITLNLDSARANKAQTGKTSQQKNNVRDITYIQKAYLGQYGSHQDTD